MDLKLFQPPVLSCLLQSVAHMEAVIDFGEDENIEEGLLPEDKCILL
jgi:hypothetical protein